MKKKRLTWPKKLLIAIILLFILAGVTTGFYIKLNTYEATTAAQKISAKGHDEKKNLLFSNGQKNQIGLIFYPGAFVKPESYSIWTEQVAKAGYDVYIMRMPVNLAVLGPEAAKPIIEGNPDQKFVLAGHSLGGVMASRYVAEHTEQNIVGMAFLASYPDSKGSLVERDIPVMSMTATDDGVLNWKNYEKNKVNLPKKTTYLSIKGGNHAGFGSYGKQKGDKNAAISNAKQQEEISKHLIDWLIQIGM